MAILSEGHIRIEYFQWWCWRCNFSSGFYKQKQGRHIQAFHPFPNFASGYFLFHSDFPLVFRTYQMFVPGSDKNRFERLFKIFCSDLRGKDLYRTITFSLWLGQRSVWRTEEEEQGLRTPDDTTSKGLQRDQRTQPKDRTWKPIHGQRSARNQNSHLKTSNSGMLGPWIGSKYLIGKK